MLPLPWAVVVYAAILLVSVVVRRKTVEAMETPIATGAEAVVGKPGAVVSWTGPWGQVRCRDGLYRARSDEGRLTPGNEVEVVGVDGFTLIVARGSAETRPET